MPDLPKNPTETVVPASTEGEGAATTAPSGAAGAPAGDTPAATDEDKWKGLPDEFSWVRDELSGARSDAGRYRTQLREAETTLAAAKTPEDVATALADVNKKNAELELELTRERLARTHSLTDDEVKLLNGGTVDQLNTTATQIAALRAKYAAEAPKITRLPASGGLAPSVANKDTDAKAAYEQYKRNR